MEALSISLTCALPGRQNAKIKKAIPKEIKSFPLMIHLHKANMANERSASTMR